MKDAGIIMGGPDSWAANHEVIAISFEPHMMNIEEIADET